MPDFRTTNYRWRWSASTSELSWVSLAFIALILALERSFKILEVHWPRWAEALPGYTVGSLGAFWTIQRVAILLGGAR